jgi:uncharacterized protein (DUF2062 family)
MIERFRQLLAGLAQLDDSPNRLAFAFGLGVFLSFSPFLGLQILIALACAQLLKLSRIAIILGLCTNLPWIVPAYYLLVTEGGARLLGLEPPSGLADDLSRVFAETGFGFAALGRTYTLLRPLLWPFTVGSIVGGLMLGFIANRLALVALRAAGRPEPRVPGQA